MKILLKICQILHGIFCIGLIGGAWVLTGLDAHILNMLKWPFIPAFTIFLVSNITLFFVITKQLKKIK